MLDSRFVDDSAFFVVDKCASELVSKVAAFTAVVADVFAKHGLSF